MNRAGTSKLVPSPRISSSRSESDIRQMRYEDELRVKREYDSWLFDQREEYEGSINIMESGGEQMVLGNKDGRRGKDGLTLGYVTKDACRGKGDDIEHIPRALWRTSERLVLQADNAVPHSRNQP
jgi:hypothetical protein